MVTAAKPESDLFLAVRAIHDKIDQFKSTLRNISAILQQELFSELMCMYWSIRIMLRIHLIY